MMRSRGLSESAERVAGGLAWRLRRTHEPGAARSPVMANRGPCLAGGVAHRPCPGAESPPIPIVRPQTRSRGRQLLGANPRSCSANANVSAAHDRVQLAMRQPTDHWAMIKLRPPRSLRRTVSRCSIYGATCQSEGRASPDPTRLAIAQLACYLFGRPTSMYQRGMSTEFRDPKGVRPQRDHRIRLERRCRGRLKACCKPRQPPTCCQLSVAR